MILPHGQLTAPDMSHMFKDKEIFKIEDKNIVI